MSQELSSRVACDVGNGAFRRATVYERCATCGEQTAEVRCLRCGLPYCPTHAPKPQARCTDCEADYVKLREDRKETPVKGWMLLLTLPAIPLGVLVPFWIADSLQFPTALKYVFGALGIALGLTAALAPLGIGLWRQNHLRRLFLAERPGERRLTLPPEPKARAEQELDRRLNGLLGSAITSVLLPYLGPILVLFYGCAILFEWPKMDTKQGVKAVSSMILALGCLALHYFAGFSWPDA